MRTRRLSRAGVILGFAAAILSVQAGSPPAPEPAQDAPAAEAAGTPRIEFTTREHDFGHKDAGPDLKATFGFKNAGTGVLRIEDVAAG